MADRADWGLWLLLTGMGLGLALMTFVATFENSAFFQDLVASTASEAMRPLGIALDGGILVSFAMTVAGIACFAWGPSVTEVPAPLRAAQGRARAPTSHRRQERRRPKPGQPAAPHGST